MPPPTPWDWAAQYLDIGAPGPLLRVSTSAAPSHGEIIVLIEVPQPGDASHERDAERSVSPAKPSPPKPTHLDESKEPLMAPPLPDPHPALSDPFTMSLAEAIPPSQQELLNRLRIKRSDCGQDGAVQDPLEKDVHLLAPLDVARNFLIFWAKGEFERSKLASQPANPREGYRDGPPAAGGLGKNKEESHNFWPTCWKDWNYD